MRSKASRRHAERWLTATLTAFYVGELALKRRDGTFTLNRAPPIQMWDWALLAIFAFFSPEG